MREDWVECKLEDIGLIIQEALQKQIYLNIGETISVGYLLVIYLNMRMCILSVGQSQLLN